MTDNAEIAALVIDAGPPPLCKCRESDWGGAARSGSRSFR